MTAESVALATIVIAVVVGIALVAANRRTTQGRDDE